jgi:hypothetical protein
MFAAATCGGVAPAGVDAVDGSAVAGTEVGAGIVAAIPALALGVG